MQILAQRPGRAMLLAAALGLLALPTAASARTVQGPTALGILRYAETRVRALRPVSVSDQFSFGLFVCGIGSFRGNATKFWLYKVNHVTPSVGADHFHLKKGDQVLWYFQDTVTGQNT